MLNRYTSQVTLFINYLLVIYAFLLPFNIHLSNTIFNFILILFLFSGNLKEKLLYALKHKVVQALFLFYAMYFLWSFQSQHMHEVLWKLKEFKYLFYIIIFITILRAEFKEKILNAFIVSVLISVLVSFAMQLEIHIPYINITGFGKLTPFFYTYSQYVLLVIISANIILYRMIKNRFTTLFYKNLHYLFFVLSTLLIFMLDSKLGYILYLLSTSFIILRSFNNVSKKKAFLGLVIVFSLGYTIAFEMSSTFHSRVSNLYNQTVDAFVHEKYDGSTGERFAWDMIGFKIFSKKPLLGYGTHEHIDLVVNYINNSSMKPAEKKVLLRFTNPITPWLQTLHNEYLDHLIQFGIVGLFILFNIFYSIYKEPTYSSELQILRFLLLIIFMLYMFVNYFFVLSQLGKVFFLLISLTLVSYEDYSQKQKGSLDAN